MGSSSGGKDKHRKERRVHRQRSDSMRSSDYRSMDEEGIDLTGDGLDGCDLINHDSGDSVHELRHRHSSRRHREHHRDYHREVPQRRHRDRDRERDRDCERDRERDRERLRDRRAQETEVIAVSESDSDSSDCVEVPLESTSKSKGQVIGHISPPSPPQLSKYPDYNAHRPKMQNEYREHSAEMERAGKTRERSRYYREFTEYDEDSSSERSKRKRSDFVSAREYVEGHAAGYPPSRRYSAELEKYRRKKAELEQARQRKERYERQREHSDRERSRSKEHGLEYKQSDYDEERSVKGKRDSNRNRKVTDEVNEMQVDSSEVIITDKEDNCIDGGEHSHKHQPIKEIAQFSAKESNVGGKAKSGRDFSPIPENGAGNCLSIEETNKLRAKLGLKPLQLDSSSSATSVSKIDTKSISGDQSARIDGKELTAHKDEWGEFLHKPAGNLSDKAQAEKLRDKLHQRKEKRQIEKKLARIRTLGESDEEVDDISKWVERNKRAVDEKKAAEARAKLLEEMDKELEEEATQKKNVYTNKHLKGLKVDHEMEAFSEGKTVILTLKDADVLDEQAADTLINVNMVDDERYQKNVSNKKKNPLNYGYDVYDDQYDMYGNPLNRNILEKYDEDLDGNKANTNSFTIGEDTDEKRLQQRKLLEIKTKLSGRRLETLNDTQLTVASDTFTEAEMIKFKKPKKKIKKLRQALKADDLLPVGDDKEHMGNRRKHQSSSDASLSNELNTDNNCQSIKTEEEEEDDQYESILAKARKLKQKENMIKKTLPIDVENIKREVKLESDLMENEEQVAIVRDSNIILNATAEFCRTLGDIPTYGMSGNRDADSSEMRDYEPPSVVDEAATTSSSQRVLEPSSHHGTWNSLDPDEIIQPADLDQIVDEEMEDVAILDEEPDVGAGVANALRLALSKGYLEKEEKNRPSNSKMAHLQAKNYSIEDKAAVEDDKFGRRDRFHSGPIIEFKDKDNFKPNIKLEYIDDNGRILNLKEAFRYLSHKFHGKGPGKNKIEKRLKKTEQDGLMKTMSSTDTPLGTLGMLQVKQKEAKAPYVLLTGMKQNTINPSSTSISKFK